MCTRAIAGSTRPHKSTVVIDSDSGFYPAGSDSGCISGSTPDGHAEADPGRGRREEGGRSEYGRSEYRRGPKTRERFGFDESFAAAGLF